MSVVPRRVFGLGSLGIVAAGLAACGSSGSAAASGPETSSAQSATASAGGRGGASGRVILCEVTSTTATKADITMTTIAVNGAPLEQTLSARALPSSETVELDPSQEIDTTMVRLAAQINDGSDVTVSMTIDGSTATSSAEGENATAMVFGESC